MRFLFLVLVFLATPVFAQNWVSLLKNTPAERFDDEDLRLFMDNGRKALAEAKVNETASWENPKTRARGSIKVLRDFEHKKMPCREVQMYNEAQGRKNTSTLSLCRLEGKWRLLSPPQAKK